MIRLALAGAVLVAVAACTRTDTIPPDTALPAMAPMPVDTFALDTLRDTTRLDTLGRIDTTIIPPTGM